MSDKPQGHGGEGETSRMLATAPQLVRMKEARPYHPNLPREPKVHGHFLPYLGGAVGRNRFDRDEFPDFVDGVTGDPHVATPETDEKSYALIAAWIAEVVHVDTRPQGGS